MSDRREDFDAMIETIRKTANDPDSVTVGAFANAVERMQAELRMIERQVDRLGETVDTAFGAQPVDRPTTDAPAHSAAYKP